VSERKREREKLNFMALISIAAAAAQKLIKIHETVCLYILFGWWGFRDKYLGSKFAELLSMMKHA